MNDAVRDSLVTGYEDLIDALSLPDPDDCHVLAAALRAGADLIVTFNLTDFPAAALAPHGLEARHPDDLLVDLLDTAPDAVWAAVNLQRAGLANPPLTAVELLAKFEANRLAKTVARLRPYADRL